MTNNQNLFDAIINAAAMYSNAYNERGHKKSELKQLRKAATLAVDAYNDQLEKDTYLEWNDEGNPVKTAIRTGKVPAKRLQFKTNDDDYMTVVINDGTRDVNLPMMQAVLGKDVFSEPDWFKKMEALAYLVATNVGSKFGHTFNYKVEEASRNFDLGADPTSDESCITALQEVFDAILFIEDKETGKNKIHIETSVDNRGNVCAAPWTTIRESMTGEIGWNQVGIVNTGKFSNLVMRAMNGIMTNGDFSIVEIEDDKADAEQKADADAEKPADAEQKPAKAEKPAEQKADAPKKTRKRIKAVAKPAEKPADTEQKPADAETPAE